MGGAVACEPGAISSASVAYTTDETVTKELNRQKAGVRWLTCTASYGDNGGKSSPSARERTVATVDCEGETKDGKDITVDGKVTHAVDGACVRGNITAKVDGKVWFQVDGLGDCDSTTPPPVGGPADGRPGPTVTVTVTQTVWCDRYPDCRPVEGK
ncbi:lipoprotein [Streptomyces tuirus]|uniref:Lipoprotein n=1 Tax=Streptomyces tuirus TaxID=68278 RepID=A0A7G1NF99_9ACTN|nr:lipoprotein [Streptomyces tuirus]